MSVHFGRENIAELQCRGRVSESKVCRAKLRVSLNESRRNGEPVLWL